MFLSFLGRSLIGNIDKTSAVCKLTLCTTDCNSDTNDDGCLLKMICFLLLVFVFIV